MILQQIKLITGETILGMVEFMDESYIVHDPMILETVTGGYVLNRYNPLSLDYAIIISDKKIIFMDCVKESVEKYYDLSLNYARERLDSSIDRGINQACGYLNSFDETRSKAKGIIDAFMTNQISLANN